MTPLRTDHDVVVLPTVDGCLREAAWEAYDASFEELRRSAIQRHCLTRSEFDEVMADPRVEVYVGRGRAGRVTGLATLTNDLSTMPLVSEDFFAHRWPTEHAQKRCWYNGFVAVRPEDHHTGIFVELVSRMAWTVARRGGVVVLDVPSRNMQPGGYHVPHAAARIAQDALADVGAVSYEHVDSQGYWAYTLPSAAAQHVVDLRDERGADDSCDPRDDVREAVDAAW